MEIQSIKQTESSAEKKQDCSEKKRMMPHAVAAVNGNAREKSNSNSALNGKRGEIEEVDFI